MADARLQFTFGNLSFQVEGSESWSAVQFDKVLEKLSDLEIEATQIESPHKQNSSAAQGAPDESQNLGTLPSFLQRCGATSNANKKFLATAIWIMRKTGKNLFTTKDVTGALSAAQQSKLANPSQSLARVVKAGFAELSSGDEYYVTPEGRKDLGLPEEGA